MTLYFNVFDVTVANSKYKHFS